CWLGHRAALLVLLFCALTSLGAARRSSVLAAEDAEIGEFVAFCDFSHRAPDDPIVIPGLPGGSHGHEFFGSVVTSAATQLDDLLNADTTCDPVGDRSAYWVPTLLDGDGTPVAFENGTFYYLVHVDNHADVQPYPLGLKVIAGNAAAARPGEAQHIKWSCLGSGVSSTSAIVQCPADSRLELLINFPDCWDGVNLDSADHKSHMAYSAGGACPSTHPVVVPALQFKLRYATRGGEDFTLSSGPGYTAHGDFFNAWEPAALQNRLECLRTLTKCGPEGYPQEESLSESIFLPMLTR
ncbi:MAG: DUF1996 domain-containing protein, partial [Caldilineaceae bacterium]|nr:DUF1996 domain-containing protein [Caldilineaceae bacterium]